MAGRKNAHLDPLRARSEEVAELRRNGQTWKDIAIMMGSNPQTIRLLFDHGFRENQNRRKREIRKGAPKRRYEARSTYVIPAVKLKDLPPIPKDTRDLTQYILGDPLPGRSAKDKGRIKDVGLVVDNCERSERRDGITLANKMRYIPVKWFGN